MTYFHIRLACRTLEELQSVCNHSLQLVVVNLVSKYSHRDQTRSFKQCIRQQLAIKLISRRQKERRAERRVERRKMPGLRVTSC